MAGFRTVPPGTSEVAKFPVLDFVRSTGNFTLTRESSAARPFSIVWNTGLNFVWMPVGFFKVNAR